MVKANAVSRSKGDSVKNLVFLDDKRRFSYNLLDIKIDFCNLSAIKTRFLFFIFGEKNEKVFSLFCNVCCDVF